MCGQDARTTPRLYLWSAVVIALVLAAGTATAEVVRLDAENVARRIVEVSDVASAATARVDASRAAVDAAGSALYPTITASANVGRRSAVPELVAPLNGPSQPPLVLFPNIETTYQTALQARQVLYAGGAVAAGRDASRRDLESSDAGRGQVAADLALTGRLAYWEAVRATASLEAATASEQRARRLLDDTRALLDAGMAVKADVLAAQSRLASAHLVVVRADTRRLDALSQLRSLLHLAGADEIELVDRITVSLPPAPAALADAEEAALAHRPEIVALAAQLRALAAREQLALAPSRPTLAATAQWELSRPNQRYFPLVDEWKDSWSVGLAASWTLFDGGKSRADARASQASQRALEAQKAELVRAVSLDVEVSRQDLLAALDGVDAADAARSAAEERERASKERLDAGMAPMVEMLDAQSELSSAEQQQIDTRAAAWIAAARLARATGQ